MERHSITQQIPLVPQTDPNNFPKGPYQPYPRMMVQADGKPFMNGTKPVVVNNEDEEADFRLENPTAREPLPSGADMMDENAKLRAEIVALKAERGGVAEVDTADAGKSGGVAGLVADGGGKPAPETSSPQRSAPATRPASVRKKLD